jgi:hypothetical protein
MRESSTVDGSKSSKTYSQHMPLGLKGSSQTFLRSGELAQSTMTATTSTSRGHTHSTFGTTDTMTRLEQPGPNADIKTRRNFLEYQLDTLRGKQLLGRFTVLDNVTNRRRGGVCTCFNLHFIASAVTLLSMRVCVCLLLQCCISNCRLPVALKHADCRY